MPAAGFWGFWQVLGHGAGLGALQNRGFGDTIVNFRPWGAWVAVRFVAGDFVNNEVDSHDRQLRRSLG